MNEETMMRELDIADAIVGGEFDDEFDAIIDAIKIRRDALNQLKRLSFSVGDEVRFNGQASPKYLAGQLATVTEIGRGKKVTVELVKDTGRFIAGQPIGCPVAIIEVV